MPDIVDTVFTLTDDYKKKEKLYAVDSLAIKIFILAIFPIFILYNGFTLSRTSPAIQIVSYFKIKHLEINLAFFIGIIMIFFISFSWILSLKSIYANKQNTQRIKDKCNPLLLYTDQYDIGCNQTELDVLQNTPEPFSNINEKNDENIQETLEYLWKDLWKDLWKWLQAKYLAIVNNIVVSGKYANKQHTKYSDYYLKKNDDFQESLLTGIIDPILIKVADPAIKIYKYAKDIVI